MSLEQAFITYIKDREETINGQGDSAWHQRRRAAFADFEKLGFPAKKDEEYRYTPISRALEREFDGNELTKSNVDTQAVQGLLDRVVPSDLSANVLVYVNGAFQPSFSRIESAEEGVVITTLSQAYQNHSELIDRYFAQQTADQSDSFVALNTAVAQEGLFVYAPKNTVVETPVLVYFISDTSAGASVGSPRNLYIAEQSSKLSVIESFYTLGSGASYQNAVSEIWVDANASVYYNKLQPESEKAYHTGTTEVYQARDSRFTGVTVSLQGAMLRNNLNIALDGENCESHMYGLYMLDGKSHVDNHTAVDHRKPNSYSNELYKGIMDDYSKGVFNGKIYVRQDAQKTNAFQSNANILLTDNASINTKPQLEIWADDVKCSHGATTGQIDKEQLFYLRARGMSKDQATAILLRAFAGDVLENIELDFVRHQIEAVIDQRLNTNF
ncbi:Fe-S cluster assembly protein SufD [Tunicatimonas pelagia]|uniref:Fe-S cluster assembly protein SufD n=1 Tax=Tunicatimonas pelagia TaxID=931531 RepID=UPI002664E893|nr:Fe-S cluster assembly protein SufD [Tunicatimonas pelagia]WKN43598.1 Fe-S cluster assembly protein SufD [Tunicatimonas pelagia]